MKECFGRRQRMRQSSLFDLVFKKGKLTKGQFLNLWVCEAPGILEKPEECPARLGITVSRKTDSRSVGRNLWKRRIREAFRRHQREIKPGILLLVQARRQEEIPSYKEIETDLLNLFLKAKVER